MLAMLLLFGVILGTVHYFSERFNFKDIKKMIGVSFTAGILITYLFLELFPTLLEVGGAFNRISLVFVLVGFTIFHVIEKYIYQHSKSTKTLKRELKEIHTISLFIYYLVLGMVLANISEFVGLQAAILFFMPLLLHAALSSISLSELHGVIRGNTTIKFLLSFSTLIGILFATFFEIVQSLHQALMGSIIGMLLYVTIVDSIPKEREGRPGFFLLGVILYAAIIALTWTL
jgi:hypothetical protein